MLRSQAVLLHRKLIGEPHSESEILLRDGLVILAKALENIQDRCIQRYPDLYGSDNRIQACMAEFSVLLFLCFGYSSHFWLNILYLA